MYQYVLDESGAISSDKIRRSSDGAFIPSDINNRDYKAYLEWLAAGNTPLPAEG